MPPELRNSEVFFQFKGDVSASPLFMFKFIFIPLASSNLVNILV